jgi:hypothetical protein
VTLDGLRAATRAGRSGVLVLRGEAGIEKIVLLEHQIRSGLDLKLVRAARMQSKRELPFAALQQLFAPCSIGFPPRRSLVGRVVAARGGVTTTRVLPRPRLIQMRPHGAQGKLAARHG